MPSLRPLLPFRNLLVRARIAIWNQLWGMDVHPTAKVSLKAHLDKTYPAGVHIGAYTMVTFGVAILTHDMSRHMRADTHIGRNCFIGAHSVILPGVRIGDGSIIAAGSVVNRDVAPNTLVGGNPAKVLRENIKTLRFGMLEDHFLGEIPDELRPD